MPLKVPKRQHSYDPLGDKLRKVWRKLPPPRTKFRRGDRVTIGQVEFHISQVEFIGTNEAHYAGCFISGKHDKRNWGWVHAAFLDHCGVAEI